MTYFLLWLIQKLNRRRDRHLANDMAMIAVTYDTRPDEFFNVMGKKYRKLGCAMAARLIEN